MIPWVRRQIEARRNQQGVVGPFLEVDGECLGSDFDVCRRVDGTSKQMTGLDRFVTVAHLLAKITVETARHQGQRASDDAGVFPHARGAAGAPATERTTRSARLLPSSVPSH